MYLQEILEVAIGMVFVWMVMSIAVMQIQEWIATQLKWRSKDLETAIRRMVGDPALTRKFYDHPLIQGLAKQAGQNPSYIPADKFALALFDVVATAGTPTSSVQMGLYQVKQNLETPPNDFRSILLYRLNKLIKWFEDASIHVRRFLGAKAIRTDKEILDEIICLTQKAGTSTKHMKDLQSRINELDKLKKSHPEISQNIEEISSKVKEIKNAKLDQSTFNLITDRISKLGDLSPNLQQSLNSLFVDASQRATKTETNIALARTNVETWFNNSMDRLSGWYKRKTQILAFAIGLFLAIMLNVDSIALAVHLWREPSVRQALIQTADKFVTENPQGIATSSTGQVTPSDAIKKFQDQFAGLTVPLGWQLASFDPQGKICTPIPTKQGYISAFTTADKNICNYIANLPNDGVGWFTKFVGIIITAAAAAQGAPFWFDMLSKLINVRGTGIKPSTEKVEEREKI